ncbi:MAG: hypothetical protein GY845_11420, partial [Planctomycetes bacterium]|nr:hypothetical protein [Planctomycetota bacterium]
LINPDGDYEIWSGVLWPGEVVEFDRTYTPSEDNCGGLVNIATAVGHPKHPDGYYVKNATDQSSWTVEVICNNNNNIFSETSRESTILPTPEVVSFLEVENIIENPSMADTVPVESTEESAGDEAKHGGDSGSEEDYGGNGDLIEVVATRDDSDQTDTNSGTDEV